VIFHLDEIALHVIGVTDRVGLLILSVDLKTGYWLFFNPSVPFFYN
jgi:hypothetical protein